MEYLRAKLWNSDSKGKRLKILIRRKGKRKILIPYQMNKDSKNRNYKKVFDFFLRARLLFM